MRLGSCSRSDDVVEPLIKPQWFVDCGSMAKESLDAAMNDENRKLEFIPKQYIAEWKRLFHLSPCIGFRIFDFSVFKSKISVCGKEYDFL